MVSGPAGAPRVASESELKMTIKEVPVPGAEPEGGVFPPNVLSASDTEQAIIDDISSKTLFPSNKIKVDSTSKFQRGFGQTDVWHIKVGVSGMTPSDVDEAVEKLSQSGYFFESIKFS